ncbi:MAG: hypothetical protein QOF90_3834 [Acetobacteraceae bacterium]|nr:hypothetical protein [Acetobacteraceae bacterium]
MVRGMSEIDDVLEFWFAGELAANRDVWFRKEAAFDLDCERFREARNSAAVGLLDHWAATPAGSLALIILLDQISRNLHRCSATAYAADTKARALAGAAIDLGFDQKVPTPARGFFYMPFMHSEDAADQDRAVRLFRPGGGKSLEAAHAHRDVVRRFGRFPHRNAVLGRANTAEEEAYLAEPGAGF